MVRTRLYISLLLLAACLGSIGCNPGIIDVPPTPVTDAAAYFWKGPGTAIFRDVDSLGARRFTYNLTFSNTDSGKFTVNENITPGVVESLQCTLSSDAVTLTGLSRYSLFPIPDGFSVETKLDVVQHITPPISFKHILAIPNSSVIATTDSGMYYSSDNGNHWQQSQLSFGGTVTALTYIGANVYAGTSLGMIFQSTDYGANWLPNSIIHKLQYPILAFATNPQLSTPDLYFSSADTVYHLSSNAGTNKPITLKNRGAKVFTSLAVALDSDNKNIIVGGTTSQGLWYVNIALDSAWAFLSSVPVKGPIKSLISTYQGFYCSTEEYIYYTNGQGMAWQLEQPLFPNAILSYDSNNIIAVMQNGSVSQIDDYTHGMRSSNPIPSKSVNDISTLKPNYFAATDSGIFRKGDGDSTWKAIYGQGDFFADTTKNISGIALLHSITGSNPSDSGWIAGSLINNKASQYPVPFYGRITGHLSSVTMPDSTSYPDVIEVQYSIGTQTPNGLPPYWQVYYAKDIGPIIIREIGLNGILRRIYRWKD